MDRLDRIREMEAHMDRVARWVEMTSAILERRDAIQADAAALSAYYESGLWMEDYEADERGELPSDLKRGILSQDGLFDLLAEYEALIRAFREGGGSR